jgi:sortase A
MKPDTRSPGGDVPAQPPAGQPSNDTPHEPSAEERLAQQNAAAQVLRQKIDTLYGDSPVALKKGDTQLQQTLEAENPYHRTHTAHPLPEADQWKAYHSAWQTYYQQYFEQYYAQQSKQAQSSYFTKEHTPDPEPVQETVSKDEALYDLRQKLLGKVQHSAQKIRRSRHFVPIIAALAVILIFVFIQYNRVFIANVQAYVSPGSVNPQNIVIDPTAEVEVGPEPRLIIPKINVDVPVSYDVGVDHASQMAAMENGLAHFPIPGANSHPGEIGNTVLSGHSSNDLFDPGEYKFIFAQLEKLEPGDTIYANYEGKRYTYVVTRKEVVRPNEVNKLVYPTDKPVMTLITCTPLGTAIDRLLVTAEQVSPDPSAASAAPAGSGEAGASDGAMPGNSPTVFERIFGAR